MLPPLILATIVLVVYLPMLIEARRAAANERGQLARGGIEAPGDVYRIMRIAYPAAFLSMILEGAIRGLPAVSVVVLGATVLVAAKALKWWAIVGLGPSWTFRVVTVPGSALVTRGPFAFVRHPNYIAVIGELIGVAVLTGSLLAGPLVTAGFALLIRRRIHVEERALHMLNRPDSPAD